MSLLSYFFGSKQKTASVAKERLSLIIAHERGTNRAPDFLPELQRDLGLNLAGAALALELLDEVEALRSQLRAMGALQG